VNDLTFGIKDAIEIDTSRNLILDALRYYTYRISKLFSDEDDPFQPSVIKHNSETFINVVKELISKIETKDPNQYRNNVISNYPIILEAIDLYKSDIEIAIKHIGDKNMSKIIPVSIKDIPLESWDSLDEKFVKTMVTRYGFYMLSILVKAYEQSITRKHFDRKIWIQKAIDLMKDETLISESFLSLLDLPFDYPKEKNSIYQDGFELDDTLDIDKHPELDYNPELEGYPEYSELEGYPEYSELEGYPEYSELETDNKLQIQELNLTKRKNKQLLKNKLKNVKTAMENTYPKLYKNIRYYEAGVEKQPEKIKSKFIADMGIIKDREI